MSILSILVLSVPSRLHNHYPRIMSDLLRLTQGLDIEILALFDNKTRTVGEKRTDLLKIARGEYVAFIDDDDRIEDCFFTDILKAISDNPGIDLVLYDGICHRPGVPDLYCESSGVCREHVFRGQDYCFAPPAHTHIWRTTLVQNIPFPSLTFGEDIPWCRLAQNQIKTHYKIDKVLYHYDWNPLTTETHFVK